MGNQNDLRGLSGWLVLVGLGVVLSPFRLLLTYVPIYLPIFKDGTWEVLTTEGTEAYHVLWGPLLIGEIIYNICLIGLSLYLIYLFFSKHYMFPKYYIGVFVVSLIFIPLDAWVVSIVVPNEPMFDPQTTKEFTRSLIGVVIWVPYMLDSKRVKATFVKEEPMHNDQSIATSVG